MNHSQKKDPCFVLLKSGVDALCNEAVSLVKAFLCIGFTAAFGMTNVDVGHFFVETPVLHLEELRRLGPHNRGALLHEIKKKSVVSTPGFGQLVHDLRFPTAHRQSILVEPNEMVGKVLRLHDSFNIGPHALDGIHFPLEGGPADALKQPLPDHIM